MGLLGDFFAGLDNKKRVAASNLRGLLGDPAGHAGLLGRGIIEELAAMSRANLENADASMSVIPQVREQAQAALLPGVLGMGGAAGIVSPSKAMALNTARNLPTAPEFAEAVGNTRGAQITPEGLLMRVQRNQVPEQALKPSVRGGVFYLPEGAAQAKHYSTGRNGYGGAERITGETLISNPLLAKGGTGGKAPEAAYDSLLGKGSYQDMRREALNVHRWGARPPGGPSVTAEEATIEQASAFLSKYAPELQPIADQIVANSGKGNQLAYALQEAAVASAVRRAGHDAVVGFSKGKSGRFVSEVFDVRESHYPDKFGTSRVWRDFERQ